MLNAHNHPVTVLMFSEDGKMLATYAYGDSALSVWQVSELCHEHIFGLFAHTLFQPMLVLMVDF